MSCKRRGLDSGEATEVELASPSCGRRLSVLGAAGAAGAAMVAPAAALESAEDLASGLDRPTRLPVPFHREPDNEMDLLRRSLANTPRAQWPKAYLLGVLRHYSMDADTRGYMLISDELHSSASGGAKKSQWARLRTVIKVTKVRPAYGRLQFLANAIKLTKYSGNAPSSCAEAVQKIGEAWREQRKDHPFDDTIYLVLLSPDDPDDYIALGGRRLYWLDDDVMTKEYPNGLLHAIEYFDFNYSPAPDGREERRSMRGAVLSYYHFRVTRQNRIYADGGDLADVWPLPFRVRSRSQVEAFRLCALLNELRELLHPGTTAAVEHAAGLAQRTHDLRIITEETLHLHLKLAKQHARDVRLLDADGQPHALRTPLNGPPPYGIQYQIGTGTTAYLYMLWYLGCGFLVAFLVSLPILFFNSTGGRLTFAGLTSMLGAYGENLLSINNVRPYDRTLIYPIFDTLILAILGITFVAVHRTAERIEEAVDEGAATAEDFTIFISEPPPNLGAGELASAQHAVRTYTEFFEGLAKRAKQPPRARTQKRALFSLFQKPLPMVEVGGGMPTTQATWEPEDSSVSESTGIPKDCSVSEVVLIKNTRYLQLVPCTAPRDPRLVPFASPLLRPMCPPPCPPCPLSVPLCRPTLLPSDSARSSTRRVPRSTRASPTSIGTMGARWSARRVSRRSERRQRRPRRRSQPPKPRLSARSRSSARSKSQPSSSHSTRSQHVKRSWRSYTQTAAACATCGPCRV